MGRKAAALSIAVWLLSTSALFVNYSSSTGDFHKWAQSDVGNFMQMTVWLDNAQIYMHKPRIENDPETTYMHKNFKKLKYNPDTVAIYQGKTSQTKNIMHAACNHNLQNLCNTSQTHINSVKLFRILQPVAILLSGIACACSFLYYKKKIRVRYADLVLRKASIATAFLALFLYFFATTHIANAVKVMASAGLANNEKVNIEVTYGPQFYLNFSMLSLHILIVVLTVHQKPLRNNSALIVPLKGTATATEDETNRKESFTTMAALLKHQRKSRMAFEKGVTMEELEEQEREEEELLRELEERKQEKQKSKNLTQETRSRTHAEKTIVHDSQPEPEAELPQQAVRTTENSTFSHAHEDTLKMAEASAPAMTAVPRTGTLVPSPTASPIPSQGGDVADEAKIAIAGGAIVGTAAVVAATSKKKQKEKETPAENNDNKNAHDHAETPTTPTTTTQPPTPPSVSSGRGSSASSQSSSAKNSSDVAKQKAAAVSGGIAAAAAVAAVAKEEKMHDDNKIKKHAPVVRSGSTITFSNNTATSETNTATNEKAVHPTPEPEVILEKESTLKKTNLPRQKKSGSIAAGAAPVAAAAVPVAAKPLQAAPVPPPAVVKKQKEETAPPPPPVESMPLRQKRQRGGVMQKDTSSNDEFFQNMQSLYAAEKAKRRKAKKDGNDK